MNVLFVVDNLGFIEPFGVTYLSAVAKKEGHNVDISVLKRDGKNTLDKIESFNPGIVAYSCMTGQQNKFFNFNKVVKECFPDTFTIMGGPHVTYYPKCVQDKPIDAICIGEGELAFVELIEILENGGDISRIKNIHTKDFQNPMRELIHDLDQLPFPDRDLLFSNSELGDFPFKIFMTSRGCPFKCSYCFEPVFHEMHKNIKKYFRKHSVDRVIEEVKYVQGRYPLEVVNFKDDLFVSVVNPWIEEFCDRFPREIGLPFVCLLRPDTITDELVKLLKEGGCHAVVLSIDSANEQIRKEIVRKKFTNERIMKNLSKLNRCGINIFNNMIIGLPGATIQDELDGIDMNLKCGVKFASSTILVPYPKTPIADYCEEKGYFKMDVDRFDDTTLFDKSSLSCFTEKEKDIQKNILNLANFTISSPFWLRSIILKHLIYWKPNRIFVLIGRLTYIYKLKKHIYPIKTTWKQISLNIFKILFPVEKY